MGKKKKTATSKVGAVSTPNVQAGVQPVAQAVVQPDGVNVVTPNVEVTQQPVAQPVAQPAADAAGVQQPAAGVQFVDSNAAAGASPDAAAAGVQPTAKAENVPGSTPAAGHAAKPRPASHGGKKSISEVIHKLHNELSELKDRSTKLVTDINDVDNRMTEMSHKVESLEDNRKVNDEKMSEMEENMTKFLSLYELINNQYNPFIDKDSIGHPVASPATIKTSTEHHEHAGSNSPFSKPDTTKTIKVPTSTVDDLDTALLELDTLNMEEAAGDAVPLTQLRNNTNSLVVILSWLEYLIKKVGIEETRNSLRYYTEVLRWITPEVFFDLDKYLRGMKDNKKLDGDETLGVKDHIVSLYFISKLNEKKLDEKLTAAVLQIIKG